ncbi:GNAT family N-acetyltransferase [Acetanaerobacterium elongatum]|uniref:Predicted N-acetyltransferase YhbS n=1 Tax=Acetanaerobacterium elongatum TaxID=258515 RepID=A0A1H0AFR6_9FIRM|nr:GNAT family N-acetyltransferase [Acetanaerobacterium elongatum]SDN31843.1 Predicted N-acetyltransferase YhbS [Acetanaerobacterium elongatum]
MQEVLIRPANPQDGMAIYKLNRDAFGYEFNPQRTCERLAEILSNVSNHIFVAERAGQVIGYLHAADYDCTYSEPLKNILAVAVEERERGNGVGRMLLQAVEAWAKESGACGVRLASGFNRQPAHQFYLACGYSHRKDQKNFVKIF